MELIPSLTISKREKEMKKIFYFIASAIVALGAVACQNDINENIAPESEGLSFTAEVEMTRIDIGTFKEGEGYPVVWLEGDNLEVTYENENGPVTFIFTFNGEEFVCEEKGVNNLVGKNVSVNYFASSYGIDSTIGKAGICLASSEVTFADRMRIELSVQNSFLRFRSTDDVTLTLSEGAYFVANEEKVQFITLNGKDGNDVWVAFDFGMNEDPYTLSASIDGVPFKQKTDFAPEYGKIYNLGTIDVASTVWGIAGELNGWNNTEAGATKLYEGDGYLYATNLTNLNGEGFKFVRLGSWDGAMGSATKTAVAANTWNACGSDNIIAPTADAYDVYFLPLHGEYYIATAGSAVPEIPALPDFAVAGEFNNWEDLVMETTETYGLYVAKGVALTKEYSTLKIKETGSWDVSYGGGINYLESNKYMAVFSGGNNIAVVEAGTFDIYFDLVNTNLYLMKSGVNYATATLQSADGTPPASTYKLYFTPNSNWPQGNAAFIGYFWGDVTEWAQFTKGDDGTYVAELTKAPKNMIILRKDPAKATKDWANIWDRIGNISVPADKNHYTMENGVWTKQIENGDGYTGGTWSTK